MPAGHSPHPVQAKLNALRTEFADLAFDLERQGRRDAADVVMMLDIRVREMAEEIAGETARKGDALVTAGRAFCPRDSDQMSGVNPDLQEAGATREIQNRAATTEIRRGA